MHWYKLLPLLDSSKFEETEEEYNQPNRERNKYIYKFTSLSRQTVKLSSINTNSLTRIFRILHLLYPSFSQQLREKLHRYQVKSKDKWRKVINSLPSNYPCTCLLSWKMYLNPNVQKWNLIEMLWTYSRSPKPASIQNKEIQIWNQSLRNL